MIYRKREEKLSNDACEIIHNDALVELHYHKFNYFGE